MDKTLRAHVAQRAQGRCEYCKLLESFDRLPFRVDHIIAIQHGGLSNEDNLAWACFACNRHKGPNLSSFDGILQQVVSLFHPRRDVWTEHFSLNGAEIIGLTATGRVTVRTLAMNLDYRVALRRALLLEGLY